MVEQLDSSSQYALRQRAILDLINELRSMGAQREIELPCIVAIGSQSSGKSSVVEAISGISLPRDAGTCTRTPTECRLKSSDGPWSCKVSIRYIYDFSGKQMDKPEEVPFGDIITVKSDVDLALQRAQAAVLNPSHNPQSFVNMDPKDERMNRRQLKFSKNIVCIDVCGPDLTDLTFIDLPGLVQNASSDAVKLTEELTKLHITGNSLILVTIPMTDDIENQKAAKLAHESDPSGSRTIGVLTKADAVPDGATTKRKLWLDVVEGRSHPLKHGYYCTRQPDDEERKKGVTPVEAREKELFFFSTTEPWNTSGHQHRFGTNALVSALSDRLSKSIDDVLPNLRNRVKAQLAACDVQLSLLPHEIKTEASVFVLNQLIPFCRKVHRSVYGTPNTIPLLQANETIWRSWEENVKQTAPRFLPFLNMDDEDAVSVAAIKCIYLDDIRRRIEQGRDLPTAVPSSVRTSLVKDFQESWMDYGRKCCEDISDALQRELNDLIGSSFVSFPHFESWVRSHVEELSSSLREAAWDQVEKQIGFESRPFTLHTKDMMSSKLSNLVRYMAMRREEVKVKTSTFDTSAPPVVNQGTSSGKPPNSTKFTFGPAPVLRLPSPFNTPLVADSTASTTALVPAGNSQTLLPVASDQPLQDKIAKEYCIELEVMAEISAYFDISCKRIIDNVPITLDNMFLVAFADKLQTYLFEMLQLGTESAAAQCKKLIAEDPAVVDKRARLLAWKKRLQDIDCKLCDFRL